MCSLRSWWQKEREHDRFHLGLVKKSTQILSRRNALVGLIAMSSGREWHVRKKFNIWEFKGLWNPTFRKLKGVVSEPKIPTEQGMKLTGEGESGNLWVLKNGCEIWLSHDFWNKGLTLVLGCLVKAKGMHSGCLGQQLMQENTWF